jgi:branched-chain amino acid transport system substrate-binding protein
MLRRTFLKSGIAAGALLAAPALIGRARAADGITLYGVKSMSGGFASFG